MTTDSQTRIPRFDTDYLGRPQPWKVEYGGLEYDGEVIVSETVTDDLFSPLTGNVSFRVVFFTRDRRPSMTDEHDPRIIMVVPVRPATADFNQVGERLRSLMVTLDNPQNHLAIRSAIEQNVNSALCEMPLPALPYGRFVRHRIWRHGAVPHDRGDDRTTRLSPPHSISRTLPPL